MQPVIAVLPPHVIDQIAAGEVVERPASVVKELADNALDAGARTIVIETTAGGRGLVRVTDDGCGMAPEDALLAFERHATSKLRTVEDLWGIASLGFRGEALPSIASVSRLVLTTRRQGDLGATRVAFEAGKLLGVSEIGAPVGTTVEVSDLLFNLPARLKFLKGEGTEASHVTELVGKLAMAYPQVHFRLRHNGRTALELPPDRDGFARARALLGARVAARMVPVSGEEAGVRIAAYLGAPDLAQTTARGVQLFVEKRPVRDRGLLHAVAMGYGELVPRGRYPVAVVLLDVPAGAVDVNVHPQKSEVRFADPAAVTAAVRHVVQAGVGAAPWRAESGATPVQMIASVAPPALPFDGHEATPLAQRYARELRARGQGSLAFDGPGSPRHWVYQLQKASREAAAAAERAARKEIERVDDALARAERAQRGEAPGEGAELGQGVAEPVEPTADATAAGAAIPPSEDARSPVEGAIGAAGAPHPFGADFDYAAIGAVAAKFEPPALAPAAAEPATPPPRATAASPARAPAIPSVRPPAPGSSGAAPVRPPAAPAARPMPPALSFDPDPDLEPSPVAGYFSSLRYLGQLDLTYLVCEGSGELVLVDQHAAHERVELARLVARHTARDVATQKLLFPTTIDATPAQLAVVARAASVLAQVGFEAEPFGKSTIALKAVPAGVHHADPAVLLRRLLDEWAATDAPSEADRVLRMLAEIACHSVVRAGDRLTTGEAESLLRSLDGVDLQAPTPHGRATLLRLPLSEIGRRFGR